MVETDHAELHFKDIDEKLVATKEKAAKFVKEYDNVEMEVKHFSDLFEEGENDAE